jgi:ATP-dependent RNA helicase DDX18/HAS1
MTPRLFNYCHAHIGFSGLTDTEFVPTITASDSPKACTRGVTGNFGRLKAKKVRALVKNASQMKQDVRENNDKLFVEDSSFGKSVSSHPKHEDIGRRQKENTFRHRGRVPRVSQSQEACDKMQIMGTEEDVDHSDLTLKHGFEPRLEHLNTSGKPFKSDTKTQIPRISVASSASNLRDWGRGGSTRNFKSDVPDLVKQRWNLSTNSDFFSKRSFRDLGCSEFMIESLRGLHFLRPSHIQVYQHHLLVDQVSKYILYIIFIKRIWLGT